MPKTKISEFSATPANNTDIDSINIAEGCAPSGINDAIRELMAQLKDWQSGTSNDPYVVGSSGSLTLNQGTANGVAYLNGSKVVTSGSALVFDGTNFGVGTSSPAAKLHVQATQASMNMISTGTGNPYIDFYTGTSSLVGNIYGVNGGGVAIGTNGGTEGMRLTSTGLGIGTSSPNYPATIYKASLPVLQLANSTSGSTSSDGLLIYLNGTTATISNEESGPLTFQTAGTLRATLDSSGNLGLGVTPSAWVTLKVLEIAGLGNAISGYPSDAGIYVSSNAYYGSGGWKYAYSSKASTLYSGEGGAHSWKIAPSGTAGNAITFTQAMTLDASGNLMVGTTTPTANCKLTVTGAGISIAGGRGSTFALAYPDWSIYNTSSGNALAFDNGSERVRIDSSGNLLVGDTSGSEKVHVLQNSNADGLYVRCTSSTFGQTGVVLITDRNTTNNSYYAYTYYNTADGNYRFLVADSGNVRNTNNSYGAISDVKLKENIVDATPKLEKLNQVRIVNYNLIGSDQKQLGVIAQELEQVFPAMVEESPDVDKDGNDLGTTTKSVKYSVFVPMLIKAIQELKAEFDAYKASHP
jgi:hypothetical protein